MGIRKRVKPGGGKVVVLSQMGLEVPGDKYNDFAQTLEKDGKVDVELHDSSGLNYIITVFKAEHWS